MKQIATRSTSTPPKVRSWWKYNCECDHVPFEQLKDEDNVVGLVDHAKQFDDAGVV